MHSPKISALFSTFNRAELLREALSSLMRQTLPKENFEVVVIDDGSNDHTSEVVASFESILPIRYAYQTNSGLAEGRNKGIRLAGIQLPGLTTSGIYRHDGQLTWWDVGRGGSALVVTLHDERLTRVIVDVDDPGVMRELEQALADAALPTEPTVG